MLVQELPDETLGVAFGEDLLDTRVHDQVHTRTQYSHRTYYYQLVYQRMQRMIGEIVLLRLGLDKEER